MKTIVKMIFGSQIYGTSTENSDTDIKGVFLPSPEEILLQKIPKVISTSTKENERAKNTKNDIDTELFSLGTFFKLVSEGQTVVMDMLFAPWNFNLETPHWIWFDIINNRDKLLSKQSKSFVGYCRTQANKYGIKGSRVSAMRLALELLKLHDIHKKISELESDIILLNGEHSKIFIDDKGMKYWEVCNRKIPFTAKVKFGIDAFQKIFDEYGHRALAAEQQNGIDWKALSHAVRIGEQAKELLTTGFITFPRPNAQFLLEVKLGKRSYQEVADIIEKNLEEIEKIESILPDQPDHKWIEQYLLDIYKEEIVEGI